MNEKVIALEAAYPQGTIRIRSSPTSPITAYSIDIPDRYGAEGLLSAQGEVRLILRSLNATTVSFADLIGNGFNTNPYVNRQNSGYGTLLVNLALQHLKREYLGTTCVTGVLSSQGDPKHDPQLAEACNARRRHFWASFGFRLEVDRASNTRMMARLDELTPKRHGMCANGFARYMPLERVEEMARTSGLSCYGEPPSSEASEPSL